MSFKDYLKERWMGYTFISAAFLFATLVYRLDKSFNIKKSNAKYIAIGWLILLIIYMALDYGILNSRIKRFKRYCGLNPASRDPEEFSYPLDYKHAKLLYEISEKYEEYKSRIYTESLEEMDFLTRWIHDVKVPISAIRLILEGNEDYLSRELFESLDKEIFKVEQSVQRVFYELKSNSLHDDYKIERVWTKKLIANTLKGYSNLFSYKRLNISILGENYEILTDEKWSGYILSQIISNAIKYTPPEGDIIISTEKTNDGVSISIKNMGKGILPKDIGQVFNKGYTSSEDREGSKSTGYGLYLSKKLSKLLGHSLIVESKYGEYALFSLTFPENRTIHHVTRM